MAQTVPLASRIAAAVAHGTILDLRAADAFAAGHLVGSSSFPITDLAVRTPELPPAQCSGVCLLGSVLDIEHARSILRDGSASWVIRDSLPDSPILWDVARMQGAISLEGSKRLWSPSPHLALVVPLLEAKLPADGWRAVDLGCGRGRDCVWLAARGWAAVGVDNQHCFLDYLSAFAVREGLAASVSTQLLDLRKCERAALAEVLSPPLSLIVVSRFMSRRLLDSVIDLMPVGCCLALHHFREGATSLKSGRPIKEGDADARALGPAECLRRYASPSLEVLLHAEDASTDGRPTVSFAVRKLEPRETCEESMVSSMRAVRISTAKDETCEGSTGSSMRAVRIGTAEDETRGAGEDAAPVVPESLASEESFAARGLCSLLDGRLLLGGKAATDEATLRWAGITHVFALTAEAASLPEPEVQYTHMPSVGGSSHADHVAKLEAAAEAVEVALAQSTAHAAVLVHCSRGPWQGGVSGAVGALLLLRRRLSPSLLQALERTAYRPRGATLAALYALEMRLLGRPSDLTRHLGVAGSAAVWEVGADAADDLGGDLGGVARPPAPLEAAEDGMAPGEATVPKDALAESVVVLQGRPMRVRAVSRDPQLAAVSAFLDSAEAAHLAELASPQLLPSRVARTETSAADGPSDPERAAWRTSTSGSVGGGAQSAAEGVATDPVVSAVVERAALLSGLSPLHAEDVQVVSYTQGQQYREHCDYFSPTQDASYAERTERGGNRLVSVFACLAQCGCGGETVFTRLGLRFALRPGEALLWMNIDRHGRLDGRTMHAGQPVHQGAKMGMNVWLRQRPLVALAEAEAAQQVPSKGRRRKAAGATAAEGVAAVAVPCAWRPATPPPRQTLACPAAQLSTNRDERMW